MDLSDDSGDETNNPGGGVTAVDENELLNSDDEEGGRHIHNNTINEEELLYEGDEDDALDFEAEDDVLDIALEDEELDTPSGRSGELSPIKLRNTVPVVPDEMESGDTEGQGTGQEGDDSLLDNTDEGQNLGSPDEEEDSTSKPAVDSDDDDDSPRTRGRFLTERKTEDISKIGSASMGDPSEGKPITTLGERNPRIAHYPDSRRGGRGGGGNFNRQNLGPRQFSGPPRGMMMGNQNLRHRQPSLLGDRPRPLLGFPNYNQQMQALHSDAPVRQLQGGFIDFNQPLRPHGKPLPNSQSPPKAQQGRGGGFSGASPPNNSGQPEQQQQNFNNNPNSNNVPGSPQQQQQQQQNNVNKNMGNRSPNVAPQKRPLAPRVPGQNHPRPRLPGAQNPFFNVGPNNNPQQQRPIAPLRQGGPQHRQHRPNLQQQNLNRPQFPGQQQHWRPNSPHNNSPQQRGMPGIPGVSGPLDPEQQPFNNNFPPLLGPQPPHGSNFGGSDNLVPPGVGVFPQRQPFMQQQQQQHQFSSPEESQHMMYRNMPPQQQQIQPILPMHQQQQPPPNPMYMQQQPQLFPPHQEHPPPPQHANNPFYILRPNNPNIPSSQYNFNPPPGRQFPGHMPHHLHHQQQPDQGWPGPHPPQHHQGELGPPPYQQQPKIHSTFQQSPQEHYPPQQQEHYQSQNPFLQRRGPGDGTGPPAPRNEARYGRESSGDSYDKSSSSSYHHHSSGNSDSRGRERYDSGDYNDSYRDNDKAGNARSGSPRYRTGGHDRPPMKRTNDFRDEQSHYGGGSPEKRLHGRLGPPVPKQRGDPDPRKEEVIKIIKESQKVMGVDAAYLEKVEEQKRLRDRVLREKEERRKHQQHSGGGGSDDDVQSFSREVNVEYSRREVRILHGGGGDNVVAAKKPIRAPRNTPYPPEVVNNLQGDDGSTNKSNKSIYVNPKAFNGDLSVLNTNLKMINMNVRSMGGGTGNTSSGGGGVTKVVSSTNSSSASLGLSQNIAGMGPTTKKKTILRIVRNKKGEIISKSKVIVLPKQSRDGSSTVSVSTSA